MRGPAMKEATVSPKSGGDDVSCRLLLSASLQLQRVCCGRLRRLIDGMHLYGALLADCTQRNADEASCSDGGYTVWHGHRRPAGWRSPTSKGPLNHTEIIT